MTTIEAILVENVPVRGRRRETVQLPEAVDLYNKAVDSSTDDGDSKVRRSDSDLDANNDTDAAVDAKVEASKMISYLVI